MNTKEQQDIAKALELLTKMQNNDIRFFASLGNPGLYEYAAIQASNVLYLQRVEIAKLNQQLAKSWVNRLFNK